MSETVPASRSFPALPALPTAVVTGAGDPQGIGFATARRLGRAGAAVAIVSTIDRIHHRRDELLRP